MKVLLHFPHGLGDAVQFTVVLKHLRKYRGDWEIDVRCGRGKHTALIGHCNQVFHDQEQDPQGQYASVGHLGWYENYNCYTDKPSSKITNCLSEVFGVQYDYSLGRYEIRRSDEALQRAAGYLTSIGCTQRVEDGKFNSVILHYEGNTSTWKKNLAHWQAQLLCDLVRRADCVPVILDWDRRSSLPDGKTIFCPQPGSSDIWGGFGSGDAETIACLVHLSRAFVGIDSGPGKCASSTDTPSLICWRDHHPMQFHDPAPYTEHLIPVNWRSIAPCNEAGCAAWFEKNYRFLTYDGGEHGLVEKARQWLASVLDYSLGGKEAEVPFVLPGGIGDAMWALHKLRSVAAGNPIDVILAGNPSDEIGRRCLPFVKRFPFIRAASVMDIPILQDREKETDAQGRYRYVPDGRRNGLHFLIPNTPLEHGQRLEEWLPEHPCDWSVINEFDWSGTDKGEELGKAFSPFAVFFLGSEVSNVDSGHNRGFLWEPRHWIELGKYLTDNGLKVVVTGANYDRSYWERYVKDGVAQERMTWIDLIGKLEIGDTLAMIRRSVLLAAYQSGLAIVSHYFGVPVITWWRPDGDSAQDKAKVCFDNGMKDSWTNPAITEQGKYLGCLYRRETVKDIISEIDKRGWLRT